MATKPPEMPAGKAAPQSQTTASSAKQRKSWKPKTPVQIVFEQADKIRAEIAELEDQLKGKKKQLEKFEEAKKLFEGMSFLWIC